MRYFVKLDGRKVVAIFRVASGSVGAYLERATGQWVNDPTAATATMFDTDVFEVPEPSVRGHSERFLLSGSRKGLLTL